MGRRSRKRASQGAPVRPPTPPASAARRPRPGGPPPAPWGSFPLVELCILLALVLGIVGIVIWGPRGQVMVLAATALGSLAGLELSVREHLAGYRSHTTVLAGVAGVVALGIVFYAQAPRGVMLAAGALVFGGAFYFLREVFRRRSGGITVKVR